MLLAEGVTKGTYTVNRGENSRRVTQGYCRVEDDDGSKDLLRMNASESATWVVGDWYLN